jgi:hypothetical protein
MRLLNGDFFCVSYMPCTLPYGQNKLISKGVDIDVQHHLNTRTYRYLM